MPPRPTQRSHVTLAQVADTAAVSKASVSRYFRHPGLLSPEIARQIEQAITRLGYRPRLAGSTERAISGLPQRLALLTIGSINARKMRRLPLYPEFLDAITATVMASGSSLVCIHQALDQPLAEPLTRPDAFDGLVVVGHPLVLPPGLSELFARIPAVWALRAGRNPNGWIDHILYDNSQVGSMAAQHLIDAGCRQFLVLDSEPNHAAYRERIAGFAAACAVGERATDLRIVSPVRREDIARLLRDALRGTGDPIGVFSTHDDLMLAAHAEARHNAGRFRLVGCNHDRQRMPRMEPRPATIDIHFGMIAEMALHQLATRARRPDLGTMMVTLNPSLVV